MCGICGIFYHATDRILSGGEDRIKAMISALRHRGPDDTGVYSKGPIALGAARLAIIDLTHLAHQPMVIHNGDYVICFNGEIYNYVELRADLEKSGTTFQSASDTEVLLRLYAHKGVDCLADLRGMFAFAIWDRKRQALFLARDRAGEKPLVYYQRNGIFAFASEIKSLLSQSDLPREIDPQGIHYGLNYVNIPAPYSAFKHIRKLKPAEYMMVTRDGCRCERYWRPKYNPKTLITSPREAVYEINRCLDHTVKIMCRSDVPIGATLSGGIDSSAVVSAMCEHQDSVQTFCVSHDIDGSDPEFAAARRVARASGTEHHELTFHQHHLATVGDVVRNFSEPMATFVPLHAHALATVIRKHVKVALTGSGGDELFGGYLDHRLFRKLDKKSFIWNQLDKFGGERWLEMIPLEGIRRSKRKYTGLRKMPLNQIAARLRLRHVAAFTDAVYTDKMKSIVVGDDPAGLLIENFDSYGAGTILDGYLLQQLMVICQHGMVDIPDMTGMASSLEYRSPFLDVEMMELAMRIPGSMKVRVARGESGGKWILRKAMRQRLPHKNRVMKKAGFGSAIPYRAWMLTDWADFITEKLNSAALKDCGLFDPQSLNRLYDQARTGQPVPYEMLWGVVMVSQWLEEFF